MAITTGGSPKEDGLEYLRVLGHKIDPQVPLLFTFNTPNNPIRELMGTVAEIPQERTWGEILCR